jgi:hypothetical protein
MDFLLECIGFPPGFDLEQLARLVRERGEPVAWRGPHGLHLRLPFPGGLEVRLDCERGQQLATLWPHFEVRQRLRVAVQSITPLPDSPYDVILSGMANPPPPPLRGEPELSGDDYPLTTYLSDARRVPHHLPRGHVIAVSVAGFALDVSYLGPNEGVRDPYILEEPCGARLLPVEAPEHPLGCMEVSLRIRRVRRLVNPVTGARVEVLETDTPGRPIEVFVSPWQLEAEGLDTPRPGWRIEGSFLFTGRVSGGLPAPSSRLRASFG